MWNDMHSSVEFMNIEIIGFKPNEKMLIVSMFKLSQMRDRAYREWVPGEAREADCVIADTDDSEGRLRVELALVRKTEHRLITIGTDAGDKFKAGEHMPRPIRWACLLNVLDTVLSKAGVVPRLLDTDASEFKRRANALEFGTVQPWYDRAEGHTEFTTRPAVLVLDPDPLVFAVIAHALAPARYRVDKAATVAEAAEKMASDRYNCIVMESVLGDDDGIRFCKAIKQMPDRRRRIGIVILTVNNSIVERMRGSMAGCDAYLGKPIEATDLLATIEKFLPNWRIQT